MAYPIFKFAKSVIVSNFTRLSFPIKCTFAVTYRCNMRCKMCNIWKKPFDKREVSVGEIEDFFKKARKFSWVGITGGEPFLRSDLEDIIRVIIKQSTQLCAVHFATNGSLTDEIIGVVETVRRKNEKLKLFFSVSIDGTPELHNELKGVHNVWGKAVETFIRLKQIPNVKPQIGFTISIHNVGKFKEAFEALKHVYPELRFDDININVAQKSGFYYDNLDMQEVDEAKLFAQINDIAVMDEEGFSINNFLRRTYLKFYLDYYRRGETPVKCQALSASLFIDPYGDLFPCVIFKKKLVNMKEMEGDLSSVWRSDAAKRISRECALNKCPVCWSPCDAFSSIGGSLLRSARKYAQNNVEKRG